MLSKFDSFSDKQQVSITCDSFNRSRTVDYDELNPNLESIDLSGVNYKPKLRFRVPKVKGTQLQHRSRLECVYEFYLTNKHKILPAQIKKIQAIFNGGREVSNTEFLSI